MKLHTINTGNFKLDGGAMFGVVPKSIWHKLNPADSNNLCTWAMRCLLIEHGNKLILIDTGIGNKQDAKFFGHYHLHGDASLQSSLHALGFDNSDITDVVLTHLHFDHCGGAVERIGENLQCTFKNATYWSNADHWQWATQPNAREKASFLKENILPLQANDQLQLVSIANKNLQNNKVAKVASGIIDELSFRIVNGHTDAMMLPQISYQGKEIVYMADLLPSVGHLPLPYVMAYDMFPLTTLTEKEAFLQEAVQNNYVLYFEHDPIYECCTLQQTEKGIRAAETMALTNLG
ncbi:MAG TPA: MBL fold metallo-hydrolase [Chitinophagaceae bacterium]|nr:MBL fold metallo-hydrolase [Chitinophagaceae bacterium]